MEKPKEIVICLTKKYRDVHGCGWYTLDYYLVSLQLLYGGFLSVEVLELLLDKFNTEISYCSIALFKAGIGAVEEYKGLVEIGKKHIEKFEKEYRSTARSENYVGN